MDEWVESFAAIDAADAANLLDIGMRGHRHAQDVADWESVISRYEDAFRERSLSEGPRLASAASGPAIHQLLPNLSFGDAISNEALFIRNELRELGFASNIFARHIDPRVHDECVSFSSMRLNGADALIYHHSIGSDVTLFAAEYAGPKCLVYHNITPPQFFASLRPEFADLLRDGREQMWSLARAFPVSVGDSEYNAAELAIFGFRTPGVLPIAVDPALWAQRPDPALMSRLQDGVRNLLFVGRVAPNKCQHELVEAFCRYRDLEEARLILVGSYGLQDPYSNYLRKRIDELGLEAHVWLAGQSSAAELHAYYRTAHLFWSMSEHEGFCAPVIEAMWFDVPVFAFRSTAVPETLGDAGSMFDSKRDLSALARTAMQLSVDSDVRQRILGRQRVRRRAYLPGAVRSALYRLIESLVAGDKAAGIATSTELVEAAT